MFHLKTARGLFSFTAESAPDFVITQKKGGGDCYIIMYKYHPGEAKFTIFEGDRPACTEALDAIYRAIGNNNSWITLESA